MDASVRLDNVHGEVSPLRVMGVDYLHVSMANGDDLYLTEYGRAFAGQLMPECYWTDEAWSRANRERLRGTSVVYRIQTRPVEGHSKDIVLKWNRMGQDVPGATAPGRDLGSAEFNSPFEEFALTLELRRTRGKGSDRLYTHRPLAIYVPGEMVDWELTGRKRYKLEARQQAHPELAINPTRNYAVIYEWIKGLDASQAYGQGLLGMEELMALVARSEADLRGRGFVVHDNKAHHLIVRPGPKGLRRDRHGRLLYAYVDFELLERTPQREQEVRAARRKTYLAKQARRFQVQAPFPPSLHPVKVFGVEYVYGHIASTNGALWVVGRDPELFDYFLPEKWRRTARTRLSVSSQVYETTTKDGIRLVWRVSKVGEAPDMDPFKADERRILDHGYNSPFEEVALAMALSARGVDTIYPRAIYRTGEGAGLSAGLCDGRRYDSHRRLHTPDGRALLEPGYDYIILWGYWNGPDELLAVRDDPPYTSINALEAYREKLIDDAAYLSLMERTRRRLAGAGVEDLNLRGNHLVLSRLTQPASNAAGKLLCDADGLPFTLVCNFELLRMATPLPG